MEKENIDSSFEKQIPLTQIPSLESILDTFKYNSIANMETKEKIRIFQVEKKFFQQTIDKIRSIWDITLSTRNLGKLDSKKKKDLESYQLEWNVTVFHLDYLENQIKEASNGLLKAFQENENGELHHQYAMIKQNGFQLSYENEEVLVPDVIPGHLFYLLNIFCCLSSVVMNAVKIQYNVISLFENAPQEMRLNFNEELKPFWDYVLQSKELMDNIKSGQEEIKRKIVVHDDRSIRKLEKMEDKVDKKNRADKRQSLTQEECADLLFKKKVFYCKKKEHYLKRVGITATVVRPPKDVKHVERTIQRWDQYLVSDGEKGTKPPKGYSREKSKLEFESWAETLELIKYERWEKRQTPIRNMYRQTATDSQEDEDYLEEDQDPRTEEDMVERYTDETEWD